MTQYYYNFCKLDAVQLQYTISIVIWMLNNCLAPVYLTQLLHPSIPSWTLWSFGSRLHTVPHSRLSSMGGVACPLVPWPPNCGLPYSNLSVTALVLLLKAFSLLTTLLLFNSFLFQSIILSTPFLLLCVTYCTCKATLGVREMLYK